MGVDKRKYQRVPADLRTQLSAESNGDSKLEIRINDLSSGGIGFETGRELPKGQIVEFVIPLQLSVRVKARITRAKQSEDLFQHGADIVQVDPTHYDFFSSFILRQIRAYGLQPLAADIC